MSNSSMDPKRFIANVHSIKLLSAAVPEVLVPVEGTTAFNCRNSLISDEWRQYVLDEVNEYRRTLALGEVFDQAKNYLPKAKGMNELKWDCNLEEMAYEGTLGTCTLPSGNLPFDPYQSMQAGFKKRNCNITSQTKIFLYGGWEEIKRDTVKLVNGNPSIPSATAFAMMATNSTTGFGCTYALCNDKPQGVFVCIYDDKTPNPANRIIYEAAADEGEICLSCTNCVKRLCQVEHTPVTLNTTCQDDKLTRDSHYTALWMHNYYRKLLASGWAKDKKSKSGFALPGKKMLALTYDCAPGTDNGANKTYALIEKCPKTDPSPTPGYSLNFLRLKNYTVSEQDALKHAIKTWWGELEKTGLGSNTTFKENSGITSFANMAHDETDKFACAVQNCKQNGETLVACQYSQKVDEGDPIYVTGKVCSGCKNLNKKCSNPQGLCE
ncbi:hypothetical protein Y032_0151g2844 [Ancylostoma ceylanicum]|uniref:SCP domain-containing protein n=3 Tax=Ancylostoma ceylanicum TaxID=53326 RepID=A0A016T066_9BILA|nr:hypothetical protein Y032_0151g2844 [Ancylostoma ceylanicum]